MTTPTNRTNVGILFLLSEKEEIVKAVQVISERAGLVTNLKMSSVIRDWVLKQARIINEEEASKWVPTFNKQGALNSPDDGKTMTFTGGDLLPFSHIIQNDMRRMQAIQVLKAQQAQQNGTEGAGS